MFFLRRAETSPEMLNINAVDVQDGTFLCIFFEDAKLVGARRDEDEGTCSHKPTMHAVVGMRSPETAH